MNYFIRPESFGSLTIQKIEKKKRTAKLTESPDYEWIDSIRIVFFQRSFIAIRAHGFPTNLICCIEKFLGNYHQSEGHRKGERGWCTKWKRNINATKTENNLRETNLRINFFQAIQFLNSFLFCFFSFFLLLLLLLAFLFEKRFEIARRECLIIYEVLSLLLHFLLASSKNVCWISILTLSLRSLWLMVVFGYFVYRTFHCKGNWALDT